MQPTPPDEPGFLLSTELVEVPRIGALSVHVDWLDLVELVGEPQAFETVGKLRDLLG